MEPAVNSDGKQSVFSVCPATGLPVYTRQEWTDVKFGENHYMSFSVIGENILMGRTTGTSDIEAVVMATKFMDKIIHEVFGDESEFAYVEDFTELKSLTSESKKYYNTYFENKKQLKLVIICTLSPLMALSVKLSRQLNIIKYNIKVEKDISTAVKCAVEILSSDSAVSEDKTEMPMPNQHNKQCLHTGLTIIENPEWELVFSNFSVRFEILDGNILHRVTKGYLKAEYIESVNRLQETIIKSAGLDKKTYYFLNGVQGLEGASFSARKIYFEKMSTWKELYPDCRLNIMYGANRMIRASFSITSYLRPFKIWMTDSLEEAVKLVEEDVTEKKEGLNSKKQELGGKDGLVRTYSDELIYFLGNINWEIDGFDETLAETDSNHPFKLVYDAVALIKMDIDELFRERKRTQVALTEGEEVARALLNATNDYSMLIQTDGTILAVNETLAKRLGQCQELMKNQNINNYLDADLRQERLKQQAKVVLTGKPVRFEDEDSGILYDNTIYPVFSAEGVVDRLAIYSRDITELKKAEKHIQALTQEIIKAQENERQRIARDLHDNVAQDLASLIISSDTLFEGFPEIPNEVRRRTMKFSRVLKRAISSIRNLAYDLRPPSLDQLGLVRTLSQYCTDFSENNMLSVDFYSAGLDKLDLDFDTEINLYRLLQEALNNVKKHAEADHITIRLITSYPDIILRIEDNGKGFIPEKRMSEALNEKRMGLKSMEERVKLLSGDFAIKSRPGEGTMILVKLPFSMEKGALSKTMVN